MLLSSRFQAPAWEMHTLMQIATAIHTPKLELWSEVKSLGLLYLKLFYAFICIFYSVS